VDAKHGMETLDKQEEAQKQVGFADVILVSKKDFVNETDYQALRSRLVQINPRAPIKPVHFGEADIKTLLDVSGFNLNTILDIDPEFLAEDHPDAAHDHSHEHHDHEHEHHDHEGDCGPHCGHAHHGHHAHHTDEIGAFVFRSNRPFDPE